jgi:NAD(P)H-flavin reductase
MSVFTIVRKEEIAPKFHRFVIRAPEIARKHKPGQFVMVLPDERGERIPLTIASSDPEAGTIWLVVQEMGRTTMAMGELREGDQLLSVVGPLGTPTHIEKLGTVVCVGGGAGIAPLLPIAGGMKKIGNTVVSILGGRNKDLVILRPEMEAASDEVIYTTDDGSFGRKGLVTHALTDLINERGKPNLVVAIGPAIMMKVVANLTRTYEIPTLASLNSIMVDGTGMCGACRISVDGQTKFVCVDGPEFDAHLVDFDLLIKRLRMYIPEEQVARERYLEEHRCRALEGVTNG